jgi:hypothetical protein
VITAILAGSAVGLLAAIVADHSLAAALAAGGLVAVGALLALMRSQGAAWKRAASISIVADEARQAPVAEPHEPQRDGKSEL